MNKRLVAAKNILAVLLRHAALLLLVSGLLTSEASAVTAKDSMTPPGLAPGAPNGSYVLSGLENLNLYNGHLNFRLPLLTAGGRGEAGRQVLSLLDHAWLVDHFVTEWQENHFPLYSNNASGPVVTWLGGTLTGKQESDACHPSLWTASTLTRLRFVAPDGTEYELRDKLTGGAVRTSSCTSTGFNRGTVFATADGSSATFVSDANIFDMGYTPNGAGAPTIYPTGNLMLKDGTRYRISSGNITAVSDRNGNRLSISVSSNQTTITDQLNRQVVINFGVNEPAPYGLCNKITFNGFNGAQRVIRVSRTNLGNALRSGQTLKTLGGTQGLFPELSGSSSTQHNPPVISAVWLPDDTPADPSDDRKYSFYYNSYGELARVVLPTGGATEYDWGPGMTAGASSGVIWTSSHGPEIYRRVVERRTYADGSTLEGKTTFTRTEAWPAADVTMTEENFTSGGVSLGRTKHYFYGNPAEIPEPSPFRYARWREGREYKTEVFGPGGTPLLRRVENTWRQPPAGATWPSVEASTPTTAAMNDPQIIETRTTLENGLITKQTFTYDQFNNVTDTYEYDYGSGAPGALVRRTHTDYVTGSTYTSHTGAHLRSLPSAQQVYGLIGGVETLVAKSETLYDQYTLTAYAVVSGWVAPANSARGNATTRRAWLDATNTWVETHAVYDQVGNIVSATDARNNTSTVSYSDAFSDGVARNTYAFPTSTASAVPDPTNQRGTNTPLTTSATYDYWTGLVRSATDPNSKVTFFQHADALERPTRVDRPDGGWTVYWYGRNAYGDYVGTRTAINASLNTEGYQFFDGLGRPARSFQHDGSQWHTTDTQYDALGRAWRISHPYLSGGSGTPINPSGRWTTTEYDALGRGRTVTSPDGASVKTDYDGARVLVTDPAGKQRISRADALGRLREVWEVRSSDPASGTEAISFPSRPGVPAVSAGYRTTYDYDALGNLRKVMQGAQTRFFRYDSLGRLIRVRMPEQNINGALATTSDPWTGNAQWTSGYAYDANGNLSQRIDARNVTTTYQYDNLDRPIRTDYSDGTPFTLFTYDFAAIGRGRFHADYESSVQGMVNVVLAYDAMGRPTSGRADFYLNGTGWLPSYTYARGYDLAGNVTSQTYPSGRTVSYTQFDVANRLKQMTGTLGDGVARTYSTAITYDEAGRISQEQFGTQTALYHKRAYNVRGQLYDVRLSTYSQQAAPWNWNRGALINHYSQNDLNAPTNEARAGSGPENNGNPILQQHWVPGNDQITTYSWMNQWYAYDALNRLSSVREQQNGGTYTGEQHYTYDRWGNRQINAAASYGAGIPEPQFAVDAATNRLGVPAGQPGAMSYDNAGNLTNDTYTGAGARTYDAENRMTSAWGPGLFGSPYQGVYVYDAAGKRARRKIQTGEVWHIYGFEGELLAEYAAAAAPAQPQKEYGYRAGEALVVAEAGGQVRWLVSDHLGSPRITADKTGSLTGVRRHDYLPFGEEVGAGVGGRTTGQGYSLSDGVRQGFTGYERDVETGLDYARARYYAGAQGRFTSIDPLLASGRPASPQSWNRYAYAGSNPLANIDPDGMLVVPAGNLEGQRRQQEPPQRRTIYIFVTFTQEEQEREVVPDNQRIRPFVGQAAPDFQSLANNAPAGTNVQVITGANATVEAFTNALQDPNAAGVFFIGHGTDNEWDPDNPPSAQRPFTADGIRLADGVFDPTEPVQVRAQTVGIFACDSQAIRGDFQLGAGQAFIGVNSGSEGLSTTNSLSQGGFAAARSIAGGRGPDAAATAAHGAFTRASGARQFTAPGGQRIDTRAHSLNTGDRVRRVP